MAHDPYRNLNDPLDPRPEPYRDLEAARSGSGWGWIVGGVVAVLLVIFFLASGREGDRTAATNTPPATTATQNTGSAPMTPPAARPTLPQENTGIAPRNTTPAPAPAPAPADAPKPQ